MPVPTVASTPAPGVPAAGGGIGVTATVDAGQLLAADRRVRANTAYRFERSVTLTGPNGSIRLERVRAVGPDGRVAEQLSVNGSGGLRPAIEGADLWSTGTTAWSRTRLAGGRVFSGRLVSDTASPFGRGLDLAATVADATDLRVAERRSDGAVLASDGEFSRRGSLLPLTTDGPRNATARLTVSERGVIRSLALDYGTRLNGERVAVAIRQRVTGLGETTVTRPTWVETALADR
jgi:hypothetical protein